MNVYRFKKRFVVLLEVLIAFTLIVLCALPLIYPHVYILKTEKQFVSQVELDHLVNLLYANRLQKLYLKEISWNEIESGKLIPIEESLLKEIGYDKEFVFSGHYKFSEVKHKPPQNAEKMVYLMKIIFSFTPKKKLGSEKTLNYEYNIVIEKRQS